MSVNQKQTDLAYEKIWNDLGGLCVMCLQRAVTIHEIVPRSRRPKDWMEESNRVTICSDCHTKVHNTGWSKWVDELVYDRQRVFDMVHGNVLE